MNPAVAILAAGFLLAVVVVFVVRKWDRNPASTYQPVINNGYTIADESIEDEKDFIP